MLEPGHDVVEHQRRYSARRAKLGMHRRSLGHGAHGHGRTRFDEHITRLEDAESRWTDSRCKEVAAHAIRLAMRRGVGRILLEDWTPDGDDLPERVALMVRRFPWYKLGESIAFAAKKVGIEVHRVKTAWNSSTCPNCGHVHEAPPVVRASGRTGEPVDSFTCQRCELKRPVDVVFAWNMLRGVGFDGREMVKSANAARKKAARRTVSSVT